MIINYDGLINLNAVFRKVLGFGVFAHLVFQFIIFELKSIQWYWNHQFWERLSQVETVCRFPGHAPRVFRFIYSSGEFGGIDVKVCGPELTSWSQWPSAGCVAMHATSKSLNISWPFTRGRGASQAWRARQWWYPSIWIRIARTLSISRRCCGELLWFQARRMPSEG